MNGSRTNCNQLQVTIPKQTLNDGSEREILIACSTYVNRLECIFTFQHFRTLKRNDWSVWKQKMNVNTSRSQSTRNQTWNFRNDFLELNCRWRQRRRRQIVDRKQTKHHTTRRIVEKLMIKKWKKNSFYGNRRVGATENEFRILWKCVLSISGIYTVFMWGYLSPHMGCPTETRIHNVVVVAFVFLDKLIFEFFWRWTAVSSETTWKRFNKNHLLELAARATNYTISRQWRFVSPFMWCCDGQPRANNNKHKFTTHSLSAIVFVLCQTTQLIPVNFSIFFFFCYFHRLRLCIVPQTLRMANGK